MAAKKRSRVRDYLVYLVVRTVICVLQALSFEMACTFGRFFGWLAYHVDRRHRLVAIDNLQKAFPGRSRDAEIDQLVRGVYRHFFIVLMEIMFLPRRLHSNNWKDYIHFENEEVYANLLFSGRPILLVTGHYGNWEVAGYVLAMFGFATHAIVRPLDNPYLDELMRRFRENTGQTLLNKHGDFARMQQVLSEAGLLATLADQDAGQRGQFVEFFGRPASTHKAVALMALEHKVVMIVAGARRIDNGYFLDVADVILAEDYANDRNAIQNITQRFTSGLEKLVRKAPEQYFWVHRRWKHQPRSKNAVAA